MHRRQRTFVELLTRSLAAAGLLYAVIIAYAVPATLFVGAAEERAAKRPGANPLSRTTDRPTWQPAHAQRFPGCVDMAKWSSSDTPSTVVVVRRGGGLLRMPFEEAFERATSPSAADDVWTIGACG